MPSLRKCTSDLQSLAMLCYASTHYTSIYKILLSGTLHVTENH